MASTKIIQIKSKRVQTFLNFQIIPRCRTIVSCGSFGNKVIAKKISYVYKNPVEEGLVFREEDYVYSSAIDYSGQKGLLEVICVQV